MVTEREQCPFCVSQPKHLWFQDEHGRVIRDAFPISKGHTLIVPKLHISRIYDLKPEIPLTLWNLAAEMRQRLNMELQPDGFNVGLNDGEAAGQIFMHAHIHVIPRWNGDMPDPRGSVRWIIPEKARDWGAE